jgi:hypothetical protein
MVKIAERVVAEVTTTSATISASGPELTQYVWDTDKRPKQDPFFAVRSLVIDLPRISLATAGDTKVSITF